MEQEERELAASLKEQIQQRNFAAAASMAEQLKEPKERIKELQEAAIKQYITEYRNAQGVMSLVQQYQLTNDEIDRLLEAIIGEVRASGEQKPPWAGKRYDIKTTKYLDVEEWIAYYGRELKRAGAR